MPDTEHGLHRVIPDKGDSPHRRREKVLVIATIILVVIGVMTILRRGSSAPPDTSGNDVSGGGSDYTGGPDASGAGGGGAYGDQLAGEIGSIPQQVSAQINNKLQTQLTNTRVRLQRARSNRNRARQRANKEHGTIVRQRHEIARLKQHPAHTGKKNHKEHWVSKPPTHHKAG